LVGGLALVHLFYPTGPRGGARRAAQAYTINSAGNPTQVTLSSGSTTVTDAVYNYLYASGLTNLSKSDVQVSFTFLAPRSDGAPATEPYQGEKGQPFAVTVTIPWNKVRWVNLGVINPTGVTFTVNWRMLVDDKFALDATLPTW
jgi:hypothetical protein